MNLRWQTLMVGALVLPVAGFAAGSILTTAADEPPRREPIVISPGPSIDRTPSPSRTVPARPLDDDEDGDDDVELVPPTPGVVGDDDDREDAREDAREEREERREEAREERGEDAREKREDRRDGDDDRRGRDDEDDD
ncbi:hypothetical protein [Nocardioides sp. R-C-SC26]|uniref:hypothetical protein n=1 Tax=Nocardioides sp. R-C-SC26 TaxID=2870414 RepID=UPI001E481DA9|nr:hypothetical protein [Nocardioides sp. R-C-SC26]